MAKFLILEDEYDVPDMDSLTMGEANIVYDWAQIGLDEVEANNSNPKVICAFAHIAYARENPDIKADQIKSIIEKHKLIDLLDQFAGEEISAEGDVVPPALEKSEPEPESSPTSSSDSSKTSGSDSSPTIPVGQEDAPKPTGT